MNMYVLYYSSKKVCEKNILKNGLFYKTHSLIVHEAIE